MNKRLGIIVVLMLAIISVMLGFALKDTVEYAPTAGWTVGILLFLSSMIFIKQ